MCQTRGPQSLIFNRQTASALLETCREPASPILQRGKKPSSEKISKHSVAIILEMRISLYRPGRVEVEVGHTRPHAVPLAASAEARKLTNCRTAQNKHTPNVRKILQSQKTFANHLDDFQAMLALAESNPAAAAAMNPAHYQTKASNPAASAAAKSASPAPTPPATGAASVGAGTSKRAAAAAKRAAAKEKEEERKRAKLAAAAAAKPEPEPVQEDVEMVDAEQAQPQPQAAEEAPEQTEKEKDQPPQSYPPDGTILPAYKKPPPPKHPGDDDPLLVSYVPSFPSDEELRALMTAPPLNYFEARAQWREDEEGKYPIRVFCEVCGYWGRVKCMKCGLRVCALDCLETHREECVTRYGL